MDNLALIIFTVIFIAIVIALIIRRYVLFVTRVYSQSMLPTFKSNDRLVTLRIHNTESLKRGDIVVFRSKEKQMVMIKRLIGLPGDYIQILDNGDVLINGEKQDEPYVKHRGGKGGTFRVPEDKYFFLGDNRKESHDSRHWKNPAISAGDLIGVNRNS